LPLVGGIIGIQMILSNNFNKDEDVVLYVSVIAVGKRERLKVYEKALHRMPIE